MSQQELFEPEIELINLDGETKTCSKCNNKLPLDITTNSI